jgi:two-component system response regulator YesN
MHLIILQEEKNLEQVCLFQSKTKIRRTEYIDTEKQNTSVISFEKDSKNRSDKSGSRVFECIIDYIHKNISNSDLTLTRIAKEFCQNPSYLSRIFKQKFGVSFVDYITRTRIETAIYLIRKTDLKSYEVCDKIGISDPNYFSKCFKKYTGMSVNDFKKCPSIRFLKFSGRI